jgi:D-glycero-D-manno-heptose 1,7-bisphosphate phosphatase
VSVPKVVSEPAVALRQCVILVGGMGTRLGSLTADTPKPVLTVGDRPFLAWLLRELSRYGFEEAVLLSGYLSDTLRNAVGEMAAHLPRPMRIVHAVEPVRAGTGGALFHARHLLDERFLLCNGDSLLDCNLAPLMAARATDTPDVIGRLLLRHLPDTSRYGVVTTKGEIVTGFREISENPTTAGPGTINGGIYIFDRRILDHVTEVCSLEREILPRLAADGRLRAQTGQGYFIDIGIPADLLRAQADLPRRLHRPALFLDRDGVINLDHGHVGTRERFEFTATAREAVALATNAGWHVFIVTNQSGVARGYYSEQDVAALHAWLQGEMLQAGGTIDDIRYCPFHPQAAIAEYAVASDWRKPAPGMLLDLIRAWELTPGTCVLVGDQPTDLAAAAAAGMPAYLFPGGDLAAFVAPLLSSPSG